MESNWPILSILIWLPIIGGLVVVAVGEQRAALARLLALVISGLTFATFKDTISTPTSTRKPTARAAMPPL